MGKSKGDTTYDTDDLIDEALLVIKKYNLTLIGDISAFMVCSQRTFYEHNLHKQQEVIEAIGENKIKIKQGIKKKWYERENTQAEKYLYLLLGTQDERDALNGSNQNNRVEGEMKLVIERKTITGKEKE